MKLGRRGFVGEVVTSGMVVSMAYLAEAKSLEVLEFRLPKAKHVHMHDAKMAKSYDKSFKTLGVVSKLAEHDDHFDLTFECPKWKQVEFETHAEVEKWEKWLKALGFETKHAH